MPPTVCPKLRLMREMIAAEEAAKVQDDRAQRKAAAIEKWHLTPAESGHAAFFQLGVDLRGAGLSMAEIELTFSGRRPATPAIRLSVGERSRASCGRYAGGPLAWRDLGVSSNRW